MSAGEPILYSLYVYAPIKGAPIFFTTAYGISTIFHIWQCWRYKAFKLIGLYPVCGVSFTAGYALREYGAYNYLYSATTITPLITFILSQVFVYVCPPLLELANYHILARILYYVPYCSPAPPGRVLAIFGGVMGLVELLNSIGVALASNPSSSHKQQALGSSLIISALSIQLIAIIVFICLASQFHRRCVKAGIYSKSVKTMVATLYASMALIFIRCLYRLVEHAGNTNVDLGNLESLKSLSPLVRYEVFFYIFEASLMLLNSALWNLWNPGRLLPKDHHIYLARDGTEVEGIKDSDDRPRLAKAAHVLTFGILFRRKRQTQEFQELVEYPASDHHDGTLLHVRSQGA